MLKDIGCYIVDGVHAETRAYMWKFIEEAWDEFSEYENGEETKEVMCKDYARFIMNRMIDCDVL